MNKKNLIVVSIIFVVLAAVLIWTYQQNRIVAKDSLDVFRVAELLLNETDAVKVLLLKDAPFRITEDQIEQHFSKMEPYIQELKRLEHDFIADNFINTQLRDAYSGFEVRRFLTSTMRARAEVIYDRNSTVVGDTGFSHTTGYLNVCRDGLINDVFSNNDELLGGQVKKFLAYMSDTLLQKTDQRSLNVSCLSKTDAYAVSIPLFDGGESWCVDSTAYAGIGVANLATYSCVNLK